jgi:hypothetical protein
VIQGFADPEAELIWSGRRSRKLPREIQIVVLRKLRLLIRHGCWVIFACHPATASKHFEQIARVFDPDQ